MGHLVLEHIKKNYGSTKVVHDFNLDIQDKEFVVLVGPSGCGKSTVLRMIAGLEKITDGKLLKNDQVLNDVGPGDRGVAMVFQDYALYPHMNVYENMAFSLRLKKLSESQIDERIQDAAKMLDLVPFLKRKPAQLSGGQRQRVAMGRAVVKKSDVFLFDEPLSNLDAKLRNKMRAEIKKFHQINKTTTVYVTHDQLEAMTLADRLVVMKDGIVQQEGTPIEVFDFPKNRFVASFLGNPSMNFIECRLMVEGQSQFIFAKDDSFKFELPQSKQVDFGSKEIQEIQENKEMDVELGIRPSDVYFSNDGDSEELKKWRAEAEVDMIEFLGKNAFITCMVGKNSMISEVMGRSIPKEGERRMLTFNLHHIHLFHLSTGENLHQS